MDQPTITHKVLSQMLMCHESMLAKLSKELQKIREELRVFKRCSYFAGGTNVSESFYEQSMLDIYMTFDHISKQYRQTSCRFLCETMQAKLPRELRDMIYMFLLEEKHWKQPGGWIYTNTYGCYGFCNSSSTTWMTYLLPTARCTCRSLLPAHLRDMSSLGADTLREFAETWYQTAQPVVHNVESFTAFLDNDIFNLGLDPTRLLKRITLDIRLERRTLSREEMQAFSKTWTEIIKRLSFLPPRAVISVRFSSERSPFCNEGDEEAQHLEMLKSLCPALKQLKSTYSRVSVTGVKLEPHRGLLGGDCWKIACLDGTTLSLDKWIERMDESCNKEQERDCAEE